MTDIIIPYIPSRKETLKYALRSIEKYLTGYKDIFIIGKELNWLKDIDTECGAYHTGVYYIPCEEQKLKQACIFNKILTAAKDERVSDSFIMWHDDHFLLQPLDVSNLKYWKSGNLDTFGITASGVYQRTVLDSNKYLKEQGYSNYHFDIHVPIVFDKYKFLLLQEEDWTKEHLIKSLYCNRFAVPSEDMKDLKFGKSFRREQIRKAIEGRLFFSTSEAGMNESMREVLGSLFPEKSKYEV